ncbi:ATP-binding protein [Endozoicomonas sp. ALB032]|uniref:ATP-binding protein n=1 Tax=Endozoicomonas sp. ALB032 TaxID=3403082 RepID=UPI003BB79DBB
MNQLVSYLAEMTKKYIQQVFSNNGEGVERRIIFNGPPLEILEPLYQELSSNGLLEVDDGNGGSVGVPVLLQVSDETVQPPKAGISGHCSGDHLLNLRNLPGGSSFLALVPPGVENNMSLTSSTKAFGLSPDSNSGGCTFHDWWQDSFVQRIREKALHCISEKERDDVEQLIRKSISSLDDVDPERASRKAAWRALSRLFSISDLSDQYPPVELAALACGALSTSEGSVSPDKRKKVLGKISDALSVAGYRSGIAQLQDKSENIEIKQNLEELLIHVQCSQLKITEFERAIEAAYLPSDGMQLTEPPKWWEKLTVEVWSDLLEDEVEEIGQIELSISSQNCLLEGGKGIPYIVQDKVILNIFSEEEFVNTAAKIKRRAGPKGTREWGFIPSTEPEFIDEEEVPTLSSPASYKVEADNFKPSTLKVVPIQKWSPGIVVASKQLKKLSLPKKVPAKASKNVEYDWETSLVFSGAGRYELMLFTSPEVSIPEGTMAQGWSEDDSDDKTDCQIHKSALDKQYRFEVFPESKYTVDISFERMQPDGSKADEICRVHITCDEVKEVGCRSEFERLIRLNQRHLSVDQEKAVVTLDRSTRLSSLQNWILDEVCIEKSFYPIVLANDYANKWCQPDWEHSEHSIFSEGKFHFDPRPEFKDFSPPAGFLDARKKLAKKIRGVDSDAGMVESALLGEWLSRDEEFSNLVETYLDKYRDWLTADPDIACWCDTILIHTLGDGRRDLPIEPDAVLLTPLHPLRFSWHCGAQKTLFDAVDNGKPCPAASVLDPDRVPDLLSLPLRAPDRVENVTFLAVESSTDYWTVLWNCNRLRELPNRGFQPPFDTEFGISVGGLSKGFSTAQVARALDDVSELLPAKSRISVLIGSVGGSTDACNNGLVNWCEDRLGKDSAYKIGSYGAKFVDIFDSRESAQQLDDASIANLSEDTGGHVRWFSKQPEEAIPDLGIIAQLNSSDPVTTDKARNSPLGAGGLIRHRVRNQLSGKSGAFLNESRRALKAGSSDDVLLNKISQCIVVLESLGCDKSGLTFAPDVQAISDMLKENSAEFVATSSSSIDPACFLGGWVQDAFLWDYDLPSFSQRAGDTNGYYLLSRIKEVDRAAIGRALNWLPGCDSFRSEEKEQLLLEVARRGIPTVRGLSGDDAGATGDLGLFLAVRLLQDQFRLENNYDSLLPVVEDDNEQATLSIVIPVDPFRGYLKDFTDTLEKKHKGLSHSRPDLLVVSALMVDESVTLKLTPIEVKCRRKSPFVGDKTSGLPQAKNLSNLLNAISSEAKDSVMWELAYQHLLLSIVDFGLRVYSQHENIVGESGVWAGYQEQISTAILSDPGSVIIDEIGRLVVIDTSPQSGPNDKDKDGFNETVVISREDAGRIISGNDVQDFYDSVISQIGDWGLRPVSGKTCSASQDSDSDDSTYEPENISLNNAKDDCFNQTSGKSLATTVVSLAESNQIDDEKQIQAISGIKLSIGETSGVFEPKSLTLNISDTRLNNLNIGVVGDLGTGKTQLLKSLIYQISIVKEENRGIKPRFLIFDYKRDYSDPDSDFVKATNAKVIKPQKLPLNLFDTSSIGESAVPWLDRFRFFTDVLDKIFSGIGPVQRRNLKNAVKSAYENRLDGQQPTIYDVHREYEEILGDKSDSPLAIIDDLVDMEIFERDPSKIIPFNEFLDGVVVISLDALGQDDRSKNMLVAIMLNMFYENMLKTPKRPFVGVNPQLRVVDSYLLVDEADNIMRYEFDVLRKLLLQGREFGVGVVLASQYLSHFKAGATDYKEPLLTWFIHKVPNVTPNELKALGITADQLTDKAEQVKAMKNHHCLYKTFDHSGGSIKGMPFFKLLE